MGDKIKQFVLDTVVLLLIGIIAYCVLAMNQALASEVNIYDSPTDPKNVVVEYCNSRDVCHQLIVPKKILNTPKGQKMIAQWLDERLDGLSAEEM